MDEYLCITLSYLLLTGKVDNKSAPAVRRHLYSMGLKGCATVKKLLLRKCKAQRRRKFSLE